MENTELKTEKRILNKLARDAADDKLLLFIGTGFSKAVVHSSGWSIDPAVPSWTELLYELAQRMGLKPDDYVLPRYSKYGESRSGEDPRAWKDLPIIDYACPTIATRMCKDWESLPRNAGKNGESFMKELIASLSDIATAVDWARHVFKREVQQDSDVVQIRLVYGQDKGVVWQDATTKSMYYISTMDSIAFLEKLQANVSLEMEKRRKENENLSKLGKLLLSLSERQNVVQAQDGKEFENIVEKITKAAFSKNDPRWILKLVPYIRGCIANARARANEDGNFQAYADWLFILLVIMNGFSFIEMPPALFALLGEELNSVLLHTGNKLGESYSANELWNREACHISPQLRDAFLEYAERLQLRNLAAKLKSLPPPLIVKD